MLKIEEKFMTIETINFNTSGTCCRLMNISIEEGVIIDVDFIGGCNGNLSGIKNLIKGMRIEEVIAKLKGITCGSKSTSCPDQLAKCLLAYIEEKSKTTV